ncbi:MAG: cytochrome c [Actinobacteria bacterium]|nr:cytochrome c [Actinomycetota bacterium]
MADQHDGNSGSLWPWLVGGLVGGAAILGLLIAAYAVGHRRGEHHHLPAAATQATTPSTTTASTSTAAARTTPTPRKPRPVTVTPALLTRGKALYQSDGCSGCHSLTGAPGAGPTFKGLAGSPSQLTNGQTVSADDAYLEHSITDPDAQIVKGYHAGIMSAAIANAHLATNPADVRALVAFIKTQK